MKPITLPQEDSKEILTSNNLRRSVSRRFSVESNVVKDSMNSFSIDNKFNRNQICYGTEIALCSSLNSHFLGYEYGLQVLSRRPSRQTRFILANALHPKDTGPVRYGDMVYLKAGESHIVGTSEANNDNVSNLLLIETYFQVYGKYTSPDIVNNYGLWKSHNENIWKLISVSGGEGGLALNTDKVFLILQ